MATSSSVRGAASSSPAYSVSSQPTSVLARVAAADAKEALAVAAAAARAPSSSEPAAGAGSSGDADSSCAAHGRASPSAEVDLSGDTSVLHWSDALNTFGGEVNILKRLLKKFEERAKPTMSRLYKLAVDADLQTLKREAYSLKGSAGYISARDLKQAAQALEAALEAYPRETGAPSLAEYLAPCLEECAAQQQKVLLAIRSRLQP